MTIPYLSPYNHTTVRFFTFSFTFLCFLVLNLALAPIAIGAQDGLFPAFDVRSRLMGGTGINAQGIDALWTNPAGLAYTGENIQAGATAEQRFGISDLTTANVGAAYGKGLGGFGIQLGSFGFDTYNETRLGLAYGRKLSENFSVGADFVAFATNTEGYASTFDVTFGLGAQLEIIPELSIGARVFSPVRRERLPGEFLPQLLAIGLRYNPTDQLIFNAEFHQDANRPGRFRGGLEYLPAEEISIRLGVASEATELSFGLGYRVFEKLDISAGAVWHEILGVWPTIGVRWK